MIGLGADHVEHGDPRQLARTGGVRIEPGTPERVRMVVAACRAGDRDEARALAARLRGPDAALARGVCGDRGIDLP